VSGTDLGVADVADAGLGSRATGMKKLSPSGPARSPEMMEEFLLFR
jgi:hypothetical protein